MELSELLAKLHLSCDRKVAIPAQVREEQVSKPKEAFAHLFAGGQHFMN